MKTEWGKRGKVFGVKVRTHSHTDTHALIHITQQKQVHTKFRGEVGIPSSQPSWDPGRNSYIVYEQRKWRNTGGWLDVGDRHYSVTTPQMQAYAGFTFRRENVQALKGDFTKHAITFDADKHQGALQDSVIYPFEMTPEFSWALIKGRINDAETELAEDVLKQYYAADAVRRIQSKTTVVNTDMQAVYLPAYVFTVRSGEHSFRLFVSGVTGQVGGQKIYSSVTVGTIASVAAGLATSVVFPEPTVCDVSLCLCVCVCVSVYLCLCVHLLACLPFSLSLSLSYCSTSSNNMIVFRALYLRRLWPLLPVSPVSSQAPLQRRFRR